MPKLFRGEPISRIDDQFNRHRIVTLAQSIFQIEIEPSLKTRLKTQGLTQFETEFEPSPLRFIITADCVRREVISRIDG